VILQRQPLGILNLLVFQAHPRLMLRS